MTKTLFMGTDGVNQQVSVTLPSDCHTFAIYHNNPLNGVDIDLTLLAEIDGGQRSVVLYPESGQNFTAIPGAKLVYDSGTYDSGVSIMVVCQ